MIAFCYARYSSDNQREESIEAQLRAIREYSSKAGYTIVKEYIDEARSATTDKRPSFLRMFDDLQVLKPDAVIVHKLDRFSRDRYDSAYYKRILKKAGCRLISVLEPLDDSPESVILESVLEGMSEYYSRNLARETMKGLSENARACKHTGGLPPLGYDVGDDKRLVINEHEAAIVKVIFEMYSCGHSYDDILEKLKPFRTKAGQPFGKNSINSILHNEKYIGIYSFGRQSKRNKNSHRSNADYIRIEDGCPRIIDESVFRAAQARLNLRSNASNKSHRSYLLSGKLICGKCGARLCGQTRKNQKGIEYRFYGCGEKYRTHLCDSKNVPAKEIEGRIIESLETVSKLSGEEISELRDKVMSEMMKRPSESGKTRSELMSVRKSYEALLETIAHTGYQARLAEELKRLGDREEELRTNLEAMSVCREVTIEDLERFIEGLPRLSDMPEDKKKEIIQRYIKKVVCKDDRFETELCIPKVAGGRDRPYANIVLSIQRAKARKDK